MRRHLLSSVAVAVLTVSLATVHAQPSSGERDRAPAASQQQQERSPGAGGERASDRKPSAQRAPGAAGSNAEGPKGSDRAGPPAATTGERSSGGAPQQRQSGADTQGRGDAQRERAQGDAQQRKPDTAQGKAQERTQDRAQDRQPGRDSARDGQRRDSAQDRERSEPRRDSARDRQRQQADQDRARQQRRDAKQDRQQRGAQRNGDSDAGGTVQGEIRTDSSISLTQRQRTQIRQRFASRIDTMNVRRLSRNDINVSISIGVALPRTLNYYTVPADIVTIYPRFRGYRFVVIEEEIVIVEPRSYRVVAVMPYGGARAAERPRRTTGAAVAGDRIRLSREARQRIRTVVLSEPICRQELRFDVFIAIPIPRTVEICEFPEPVIAEVPEMREYRYLVRDDEIVIVDPRERRVVEVID